MKAEIWLHPVTEKLCPPWPCPICNLGTTVLEPSSLTFKETASSKKDQRENSEAWEPDWRRYTFTAWARCSHFPCSQSFAMAGNGKVFSIEHNESRNLVNCFEPKACVPMPYMFEVPALCPENVEMELKAAFSIFWQSPSACAGRVRVALEFLMDHLKVPRKKRNAKRKFHVLNLHQRIEIFSKAKPDIGHQLMAIKWLGNSGSHKTNVSEFDILEGFEILEHTLAEIVGGKSTRITKMAKAMVKRHRKKK